jgi:hypothetical protein
MDETLISEEESSKIDSTVSSTADKFINFFQKVADFFTKLFKSIVEIMASIGGK